jgi:PQQ-dependent catabolism-associated CXXCW motif protein
VPDQVGHDAPFPLPDTYPTAPAPVTNPAMAGHVFISHASENRDEANALVAMIEAKGVTAWIAPRDVRPGFDYSEELQAAIETCTALVVIVTEMSNKSPYVRAETEMAFSCQKPMLPVRLGDIAPAPGLAFFLKIRHWTDAYGANREANLARLVLELQTLTGNAPSWAPRVGAAAAPPPLAETPPPPPPAPAPAPSPAPAQPQPQPQPAGAAPAGTKRLLPWLVGGLVVLAAAAAAYFLLVNRGPATPGPQIVNGFGPAPTPSPNPGPTPAPNPQDRAYGGELTDFGVQAKSELESNVGAPTPLNISVGERVTTAEVQRALRDGTNPILVDVLATPHAQTLPNALYMPAGGMPGSFNDEWQTQFAQQLAQATNGDTGRPVVFFCQGASCWESYNAVLRASAGGHTNLYWYRGGLFAWQEAGLTMSPLPAPYGGGEAPNGD